VIFDPGVPPASFSELGHRDLLVTHTISESTFFQLPGYQHAERLGGMLKFYTQPLTGMRAAE
jgi:hypothetical protein